MTRDEAEAAVPRVKAALAEAGYPDAVVFVREAMSTRVWSVWIDGDTATPEAMWTAFLVSGLDVEPGVSLSCWSCWRKWYGSTLDCNHDPWMSERPRLERRTA